jgi:hypothetical protein
MTGRYWVDANSFIWGSRDPCPMPGAMAYWNWFESMVDKGKIISHWKAIKEVTDGEGKGQHQEQVVSWVKTRKNKLVDPMPDSEECQKLVGDIHASPQHPTVLQRFAADAVLNFDSVGRRCLPDPA